MLREYPILRALHSRIEEGSEIDTVFYSWKMFCHGACISLLLLHFLAFKACHSCPKVSCSLVLRILFQMLLSSITHVIYRYPLTASPPLLKETLFCRIKWLVTGRLLKATKIIHQDKSLNIVTAVWRIKLARFLPL